MPELSRLRVKNGRRRGILRYAFNARSLIPGNSKCSLRPSQHAEGLTFAPPQEYVSFFTWTKSWHSTDARVQIADVAAQHSNADHAWKQAFVYFYRFKARFRPNLSVLPAAFDSDAPQPRHGRCLIHELLETQPRKRGGVCRNRKQHKPSEKQNPQESAALDKAHFNTPPARRSRRSYQDWCSGRKACAPPARR